MSVREGHPRTADLIGKRLMLWPRTVAVGLIRAYQKTISPMLSARCRFAPTCSEYTRLAIFKYGVLRGGLMGLRRIARCHPWHPGGYDPLP